MPGMHRTHRPFDKDDERHSIGVANNDASPFKHMGDDDDYSHGSIECHSSMCPRTT